MDSFLFCKILLVTLLLRTCAAFYEPFPSIRCYVCENCENNEEAIREWAGCRPGQFCSSAFTRRQSGEMISVRKRCVNRCSFPGTVYNISDRGFRYCCDGDLCNEGLQPEPVPSPMTSPTPAPPAEPLPKCEKGEPGLPGLPGLPGRDGFDGLPGRKGDKGAIGPPGASGISIEGTKGERGYDGLPGTDGRSGREGPDGAKGVRGYDGLPGLPGLKGSRGSDGSKGERGECECPERTPSSPIAFHGTTNARQTSHEPEALFFDNVSVNENGGNDTLIKNASYSSMFTIPEAGLYAFHVSSIAYGNKATSVELLRGNATAMYVGRQTGSGAALASVSKQAMLYLEIEEEMSLVLPGIDSQENKNDDGNIFNKFSSISEITFSVYRVQ